jgi:hypothetical protein
MNNKFKFADISENFKSVSNSCLYQLLCIGNFLAVAKRAGMGSLGMLSFLFFFVMKLMCNFFQIVYFIVIVFIYNNKTAAKRQFFNSIDFVGMYKHNRVVFVRLYSNAISISLYCLLFQNLHPKYLENTL